MNRPKPSPDFDRFTEFMRKLVSVPHDEIKARLDAEKAEKNEKRKSHQDVGKNK